jgi:hypothetical protein
VHRFRSKDAYARFIGTAPIPVWSGNSRGKVRLNRGGNRTPNCALHMIAVTQVRGVGPGKARTYSDIRTHTRTVEGGQVVQLLGVDLAARDGHVEDGGVGGDADDVLVADQGAQQARHEPAPAHVVEPDRDTFFGKLAQRWVMISSLSGVA